MHELFGTKNFSSVSLEQLSGNRFAPAALEGKLINLSEESSGNAMTSSELNVIKNLSAGGNMRIERKGQDSFEFKNKAKLIFSANKTPIFKETGTAIKRRLLAIPFDFEIKVPDPTIEARLIADVPKILSMLVTRIQKILEEHGGRFKINRGSTDISQAQERFLLAGNTSMEWAREHLSTSPHYMDSETVEIKEAYSHYISWCNESGYKYPDTRNKFGQVLRDHFVTKTCMLPEVAWKNGKSVRVFRRTKWIEGSIIP